MTGVQTCALPIFVIIGLLISGAAVEQVLKLNRRNVFYVVIKTREQKYWYFFKSESVIVEIATFKDKQAADTLVERIRAYLEP